MQVPHSRTVTAHNVDECGNRDDTNLPLNLQLTEAAAGSFDFLWKYGGSGYHIHIAR